MITGFRLNLAPLKEPLGFIKFVEWDFGLTAAIAFLWLVCSSAWAKGLQNVKDATGTAGITSTLALCKESDVACEVTDFANMRTLNVSVVFGYLNLIVWAGNAWIVYKETRCHSQKYTAQHGAGAGRGQQVPAAI
ncbi:synaptophysin-like protein 1 [Salvelinus sp. IW2-2015]|uniref:synaptophysin-like protein 1 n=1 Tax=Salvelinus sp. IW2-2015 TaxID=2691554 RepID=UPI000CDFC888|nr:synaptophysin-like protein 1 [Salvelinus alpinus]